MKHNIGIDLDGVVCNIYDEAFPILKHMYPNNVKTDAFTGTWEKEFNLTEEQVMDCFKEVGRRGILRRAKIYPGAKESLYKLNRKYNIFFVSWRNYIPNSREDTLYWLDSNKIPYEKLVITNNKHKVAMKEQFCFFLDDNVMQCNRMAKSIVPTYLYKRPWNDGEQIDALVKIVKGWKEIEKILLY